jgi:HTH-type transcriptional regulator/antitoxin HigA
LREGATVAEAFHPGEFLRDELAARGLSAAQFAEASGLHANTVAEILGCALAVNAHAAFKLARALGTSPELWLSLQQSYDQWAAR